MHISYFKICGKNSSTHLGFKNFVKSNPSIEIISFLKEIAHCQQGFKREKQPNGTDILSLSIKFFSDTLIITYPLQPEKTLNFGTLIQGVLPFINLIALRALMFGLLLRGAMTIGRFFEEDGVVLGSALNHAQELESNVAIYPRIVISNEILEKQIVLFPQSSSFYLQPIIKDFDGIYYLNYFSIYGQWNKAMPHNKTHEWLENCYTIINKNITEYSNDKRLNLLQKWRWFKSYFNMSMRSLQEGKVLK